jgi:uncharacterized membrane protein
MMAGRMRENEMKNLWPQALIMGTGLVLVLLGILGIGAQLFVEFTHPGQMQQQQQIQVSASQLSASTRFVGLELIVVGALLEIVGFFGTRPWRQEGEPQPARQQRRKSTDEEAVEPSQKEASANPT